jgi:hypothetical protein
MPTRQAAGRASTQSTSLSADAENDVLQRLLQKPSAAAHHEADSVKSAMPPGSIVLGRIQTLDAPGLPQVTYQGVDKPRLAMSLIPIDASHVGRLVALSFPAGADGQPLVLGAMWMPDQPALPVTPVEAIVDGRTVVLEAAESVTLRCGEASITLTADGQILLRGAYISSHSTGTQRIKGAAVKIN